MAKQVNIPAAREILLSLLTAAVLLTASSVSAKAAEIESLTLDCSQRASIRITVDLHVSDPSETTGLMALYSSLAAAQQAGSDGTWQFQGATKTKLKLRNRGGKKVLYYRVAKRWQRVVFSKKEFKALDSYVSKRRCKRINFTKTVRGQIRFFTELDSSLVPVTTAPTSAPTTGSTESSTTTVNTATETTATTVEPVEETVVSTAFAEALAVGTVDPTGSVGIVEASGIVASEDHPGVLWVLNDSGNPADIYAISSSGEYLGTYSIGGVNNIDWEAITLGPGPDASSDYIYIGDIGDNAEARSSRQVYRFEEPAVSLEQAPGAFSVTAGEVATLNFDYPDGAHNAETLTVDPTTNDLYILTKNATATTVYRIVDQTWTPSTVTAENFSSFPYTWISDADISPDGSEMIVRRNYDAVNDTTYLFQRSESGEPWGTLQDTGETLPYTYEPNGEAVTFGSDGLGFYTVSEGVSQPLYYYARQ